MEEAANEMMEAFLKNAQKANPGQASIQEAMPLLVAPYAAYQEVHMYVGNEKALEYLKKRLKLRSAEQGANHILMLPYYKHSVFYDSRIKEGLRVVSDIQLYLDLHGYPIRGLEQAEHLLDKKLKPLFAKANSNE